MDLLAQRSSRAYMKFEHQTVLREPITHRDSDRRTLLFLLKTLNFERKLAKNGHYALTGAR